MITQPELAQREHMEHISTGGPRLESPRRKDRNGSSQAEGQYRTEEGLRKIETDMKEHKTYFWNVLFFFF